MSRIAAIVRRHWGILTLVALGALLRVLVMLAYQPAFWFFGDSGSYIKPSGGVFVPQPFTASGYTAFVQILKPTGTLTTLVALQHLAGLAIGIGIYAFLRHRGLPSWLACLAATPVLFDSLQLTLEHYVMTETMFTSLLIMGILLQLWWPQPPMWACVASGVLIAGAWVTRPSTLPVIALLAAYLLIRRLGLKRAIGLAAPFVLIYGTVLVWVGEEASVYRGSWAARALYSRTAVFADCDRLKLTDAERALCPAEPVNQRHDRADWYGWNGAMADMPAAGRPEIKDFAIAAIRQQPSDYIALVAKELSMYFLPGQHLGPEHDCLRQKWNLPASARSADPPWTTCHPALARAHFESGYADPSAAPEATPLSRALHWYSDFLRSPQLLVTLCFLLMVAAAATSRRIGWRDSGDAVLLGLISLSLFALPVAVGMYDARYGLPALPLVSIMGALALQHLRRHFASSGAAPPDVASPRSEQSLVRAGDGPPL